jgi:hypothetical protein
MSLLKILIILMFFFHTTVYACEINLSTDKKNYKIGDTAIVKLILKQNHKTCIKEEEEPKIVLDESKLELKAKTKFKADANDTSVRTLSYKVIIKSKDASFTVYRNCPQGGSTKTIKLEVQ